MVCLISGNTPNINADKKDEGLQELATKNEPYLGFCIFGVMESDKNAWR
jgi:hypothetical protein